MPSAKLSLIHHLSKTPDADDYFRNLIQQGKSARVEFKTSFQKELIETLVAFANSKGGLVLVGVSDAGQVTGVDIKAETLQGWVNQCKQNTTPSVIPDIEVILLDGKTVAVISVDEYPIKPVACKGRYFKRIGNANHQMSPTEISDAHIKLINSSWDYHPDPVHGLDSISQVKVQAFADALSLKASFTAVLEKFELIKDERPTFGCHLLFSKNDVLLSTIEAGRFATQTVIKDSITSKDSLIEQVTRIMDFIRKHTNKAYIITGNPKREERWDYPMDAIREIVINMIVHRDYRSANDSTIKIFDDRIEFFNPGTLLEDLTVEKIKSGHYKSHLRNKQIASIFKELNLIEKYGSGVRRAIETFVAYGLPEPVYEATQGGMAVTVFKETLGKEKERFSQLKDEGVNEGVNFLLAVIKQYPGLRVPSLAEKVPTSSKNIERWLKQLKETKRIEFRGASKTGGYFLTTKVELSK
ncbi:MAG: AAA family ATPase [Methylococcaceae bacterium]|nr:MAG: AAA family ATPase [Methylococcaceae bacterium]